MTGYLYIAMTIAFTVYGQVVLKWQMAQAGALPPETGEKLWFLLRLCLNPWIVSGFVAAFLAALSWMAAMTRFELSYAYPFMSLSFVLVMLCSAWLFHEPLTGFKVAGIMLVILGLVVGSRG